jgi:anti-sigma regulatory factor (Ser/Thr protein kinase)
VPFEGSSKHAVLGGERDEGCAVSRGGARLHCDALAPAQARAHVREACARLPHEVLEDVLLLTTELVDNALWHGAGDPVLDIDVGEDSVLVGVTDHGIGTVHPAAPYNWPESGHGLRIITALADTWGVEPTTDGRGKRVWFRLSWGEGRVASPARPSAG